jgi:hypothetical protein
MIQGHIKNLSNFSQKVVLFQPPPKLAYRHQPAARVFNQTVPSRVRAIVRPPRCPSIPALHHLHERRYFIVFILPTSPSPIATSSVAPPSLPVARLRPRPRRRPCRLAALPTAARPAASPPTSSILSVMNPPQSPQFLILKWAEPRQVTQHNPWREGI